MTSEIGCCSAECRGHAFSGFKLAASQGLGVTGVVNLLGFGLLGGCVGIAHLNKEWMLRGSLAVLVGLVQCVAARTLYKGVQVNERNVFHEVAVGWSGLYVGAIGWIPGLLIGALVAEDQISSEIGKMAVMLAIGTPVSMVAGGVAAVALAILVGNTRRCIDYIFSRPRDAVPLI